MDQRGPSRERPLVGALLAHEHGLGLALEVDIGLAADIDRDPFDGAAGEAVGTLAGVVMSDGITDITTDGETLTGDHEAARLGLDATLTDLLLSVVEREDAGG